ncbi:MAG: hypothetical protein HYZ42_17300, partial [Bacteroidetes bacterium]|nr:hypothetical protein [Bacteroidota bacterium]
TYSINPADSVGTKIYTHNEENFNPDLIDFKAMNIDIKRRYRYKEIGEEKILGKTCQIIQLENGEMNITSKYWLYKFIPLKMEIKILRHLSTYTATKFEENIKIDEHQFDLPSKIKLIKVSNK